MYQVPIAAIIIHLETRDSTQISFFSVLQKVRNQCHGATLGYKVLAKLFPSGSLKRRIHVLDFSAFSHGCLLSLLMAPSSMLQSEKHNILFPLQLLFTPCLSDFDFSFAYFMSPLVISGHRQITRIVFSSQVPQHNHCCKDYFAM